VSDDLGKDPAVYNRGLQQPPDVPGMKLGKLSAKFLAGLPSIGIVTESLPLPPPAVDYSTGLHHLGPMGNNTTADCTVAAIGHAVQTWTSLASTEAVIPDAAIIQMYADESGYVIGDPNTDNGAVASDMLLYWYKNPIDNHALAGFASIRPGNRTSMRDAIYWFGACYIGIQLPLAVRNGGNWMLPDGQSLTNDWAIGSWGGHAIPAIAYNADTVTVISWGKLLTVNWAFMDAYCDEAYGLLSKDWLTVGNSPPGLNWQALQDAMNQLRASS
jgi:hypothetical protein